MLAHIDPLYRRHPPVRQAAQLSFRTGHRMERHTRGVLLKQWRWLTVGGRLVQVDPSAGKSLTPRGFDGDVIGVQ